MLKVGLIGCGFMGQMHANCYKNIEGVELVAFADKLEKATVDTIESGMMTKDLALITSLENPTVLNSQDFIKAIAARL